MKRVKYIIKYYLLKFIVIITAHTTYISKRHSEDVLFGISFECFLNIHVVGLIKL